MHIGNLSFCDRVALNIRDDATKRRIMEAVAAATGMREEDITRAWRPGRGSTCTCTSSSDEVRFPPDSEALFLRTDGNPYLMCLLRLDGVDHTVFVDRKVNRAGTYALPRMILARTCFRMPDYVLPTVVDGEIVRAPDRTGPERWTFLATGCLAVRGARPRGAAARHEALDAVLPLHVPTPGDACGLVAKRMLPATRAGREQADRLAGELLASKGYSSRGVYVYSRGSPTPVLYNFDDSRVRRVERLVKNAEGVVTAANADAVADADADARPRRRRAAAPSSAPSSAPPARAQAQAQAQAQASAGTTLRVRSTDIPDAYEIVDGPFAGQYLGVPTIGASLELLRVFESLPVGSVRAVEVEVDVHGGTPASGPGARPRLKSTGGPGHY